MWILKRLLTVLVHYYRSLTVYLQVVHILTNLFLTTKNFFKKIIFDISMKVNIIVEGYEFEIIVWLEMLWPNVFYLKNNRQETETIR